MEFITDDDDVPDWVIKNLREKPLTDEYLGLLKTCMDMGVKEDVIEKYFPNVIEKALLSQPYPIIHAPWTGREALWILPFLFQESDVVLEWDALIKYCDELTAIGDGPSYPHANIIKVEIDQECSFSYY